MLLAATSVQSIVTSAAVIGAAVFLLLERLGILERLGLVRGSAVDASAEIQIQEHTIARLRAERNAAEARAGALAQTRSLEPIIAQVSSVAEQLAENSKISSQILDRLAEHNGSFAEMHRSLQAISAALERRA